MSQTYPSTDSSLPVRKPDDISTINIHEPDELRWWVAELGVGMEKLLLIVLAYGEKAEAVRKYIKANCNFGPGFATAQ